MRITFTADDGTAIVYNLKKTADRREMATAISNGTICHGTVEISVGHGDNVRKILYDGYSVVEGCKRGIGIGKPDNLKKPSRIILGDAFKHGRSNPREADCG
jgi:hypothetical protein